MDKWIIKSVESQNNAMNNIINKIKENLDKANNIGIDRAFLCEELDLFSIYEKYKPKFKEFEFINYKLIKKEDKTFDINELYKIYLDVKIYEIHKNYVTVNSIIDILFKKHLFDYKSKGLMNCFKELSYSYLNKFIKNFIIKTPKGQNLIRIDRLFTILLLINYTLPNKDNIISLIKETRNKLKFNCFLSKNDFINCNFWFDINGNENHNNLSINKVSKLGSHTNLIYIRRMSKIKSKRNSSNSLEGHLKELNKDSKFISKKMY